MFVISSLIQLNSTQFCSSQHISFVFSSVQFSSTQLISANFCSHLKSFQHNSVYLISFLVFDSNQLGLVHFCSHVLNQFNLLQPNLFSSLIQPNSVCLSLLSSLIWFNSTQFCFTIQLSLCFEQFVFILSLFFDSVKFNLNSVLFLYLLCFHFNSIQISSAPLSYFLILIQFNSAYLWNLHNSGLLIIIIFFVFN